MKRSIFFTIIAVLSGFFGLFMSLATSTAAEGFGMEASPQYISLMRSFGLMLFSTAVLAFLVRNDSDSKTMKSVLIFNVLGNGLGVLAGVYSVMQGTFEFAKIAPGLCVPLIGTIGFLIYLLKMNTITSEK